MVDREVDEPVWVILGRSWDLCVRSWAALGAYVGGLGAVLAPILAILGRSWASTGGLGCTWAARGAYVGDLGPLLSPLPSSGGIVRARVGSPFICFFASKASQNSLNFTSLFFSFFVPSWPAFELHFGAFWLPKLAQVRHQLAS